MSFSHVCPFCEEGVAHEVAYSTKVKFGRKNIFVENLKKTVCSQCNSESIPEEFFDLNHDLIRMAVESCQGAVSEGMIRDFREKWSLTQISASRLFGAGDSAFAKWESKQSKMSTPAALLMQVANKFPEVVQYLASLADVQLSKESESCGHTTSSSSSSYLKYQQIQLPCDAHSNVVLLRARSANRVASPHHAHWKSSGSWRKEKAVA